MNQEKLLVLIINDMVIFPNNEVRIEYDNTFDKQMISIIEKTRNDSIFDDRQPELIFSFILIPFFKFLPSLYLKSTLPVYALIELLSFHVLYTIAQ